MKDPCPCRGCKDRTYEPNCHGLCLDRYIPWAERQEKKKEKAKKNKNAENDVIRFRIKSMEKIYKSKKKKR